MINFTKRLVSLNVVNQFEMTYLMLDETDFKGINIRVLNLSLMKQIFISLLV